MGKTPITPMRLDPELAEWVRTEAKRLGYRSRAALVAELLQALRGRRLVMMSTPAPHVVNDGSDPNFPVLICRHIE